VPRMLPAGEICMVWSLVSREKDDDIVSYDVEWLLPKDG